MKHRALVTGSAGRIGRAVAQALAGRGHFVRGFDRGDSNAGSEHVVGSISDFEAMKSASAGMDTVIHLAATPDDADFMSDLLPNNIVSIHHVLEAARLQGVRRVILASSGQVVWRQHHHGPFPVRVDDELTPRYWYAVTKVFAEFAGKIYADRHGLEVICVRLGACPRDRAMIDFVGRDEIARDVYLSPADAGRFFSLAVECERKIGYEVVYVTSKWVIREVLDLEPARRLFGYEPRDRWPEGVPAEIIGEKAIPGVP